MLNGFTSAINISVFGTSDMKAFDAASKRLGKFAGNFESAAKKVKKAGRTTMLIGAGIAAALALPAIETGKFNTQLAKTGGLVGATSDELAGMSATAKHFGATTLFTANQVAEGQESLVRLGLSADDVTNRTGIMAGTLSFATGQQKDMAEAGTFLVGSMNAMRIPLEQATSVADKYTTVIAKSGNNFDTLQESMANSAGTAMSYGQSMDSLLAVLGVLADRQEKGSRAGTRLSGTMTKIYTQGGKIKDALGVDVYDQATGKTRDLIDVFSDMQGKLKGMSEEQKNSTLTEIFGGEGIKVFNLLLTSSREQLLGLKKEISGSAGEAARFEDIIKNTPWGMWELMKSAISGVTMRIGEDLIPIVSHFLVKLTGISNAILGWMNAHPVITKFVVGFAAFGAVTLVAAGALLMVGGSMMMVSSMAIKLPSEITRIAFSLKLVDSRAVGAARSIMALSWAFVKMVAPFALVAGAVYVLSKMWSTNFWGFKDAILSVWAAIKPVFAAIGGVIRSLASTVVGWFGRVTGAIGGWLKNWHEKLTGGVQPFMLLVGAIAWGLGYMIGLFGRAWSWIKGDSTIQAMWEGYVAYIKWVIGWIEKLWPYFWDGMKLVGEAYLTYLGWVWDGIVIAVQWVAEWVEKLWPYFSKGIKLVWDAYMKYLGWVWENLVDGIMWARDTMDRFFTWLRSKGGIKEYLGGLWDGFKSGLNGAIDLINLFIKGVNLIPGVEIPMIPTLEIGSGAAGTTSTGVSSGLSPSDVIQNSSVSTSATDRSVKIEKIEVVTAPNTPAQSIEEQILNTLRKVAGQDDGVEGLTYAGT